MATIERTGLIDAPIHVVWDTLSDFAAISAWAPNVDHSCLLSDQTQGIGMVRRIQTDRTTVLETVESWEAGATLSYRITGLPPVIKSVINTWQLETSGESTEVRLTTDVDAGPKPPQQLIAKAVGRRLAAASEQMINGLASYVEQGMTS